jgi:putative FmdB family regulatory protein
MPNYEYLCQKCGHRFEKIQKFSDPMLKKCPECGGKIEQVISAPAVQFKGSGWYVTDYAKKSAALPASGSDSGAKGDSGKDSGSKDSESSGPKNSGAKDSGSKDSGAKDSASKKDGKSKSETSSSKSSRK